MTLVYVFDGSNPASVSVLLTILPDMDGASAAPRGMTGVSRTAPEVFGDAWEGTDPATPVIEDAMNFSIFGGCNRFAG